MITNSTTLTQSAHGVSRGQRTSAAAVASARKEREDHEPNQENLDKAVDEAWFGWRFPAGQRAIPSRERSPDPPGLWRSGWRPHSTTCDPTDRSEAFLCSWVGAHYLTAPPHRPQGAIQFSPCHDPARSSASSSTRSKLTSP